MSNNTSYHVPVMLQACTDALRIQPNGVYVDCTFGGGGHSSAILAQLGPAGRLVAFDQDADAAANLPKDDRLIFVPHNFRHVQRFLRMHGIGQVDGLLADLGVSSHQFDEGSRGFSYRFDAPLDMRMDQRAPTTAATLLNSYTAQQLQHLLSAYGEVTNARTLAQALVEARQSQPFASIAQLLQVLAPLSKGNPHRYYAQVFQALRIAVNAELEALEELLTQLTSIVKPGGRIAFLTFHSLEDRLVKQFFKQGSLSNDADPIYGHKRQSPFVATHKKPIEATPIEVKANPRASSAKLRVVEVIEAVAG
ncbi:MAG: 16S rRNA (cytosine(1402)-N(4))-methyltransferase RsmH [Bacteroidetes bacterium]|nr:MAG: 16S rRNA (cytosine(1402)-N(4))-methyltransferase RsmH [Bacteroidota bacterium]